jgi:hypothetical protein
MNFKDTETVRRYSIYLTEVELNKNIWISLENQATIFFTNGGLRRVNSKKMLDQARDLFLVTNSGLLGCPDSLTTKNINTSSSEFTISLNLAEKKFMINNTN